MVDLPEDPPPFRPVFFGALLECPLCFACIDNQAGRAAVDGHWNYHRG